jgi:hypothetical protein
MAREVVSEPTRAIHTYERHRGMQRPAPDAEGLHVSCWRRRGGTVVTLFVVAVLANYLWELAQAPLYVGMESFRAVWWHCFIASLGDGLLVLGIFATGWVVLRRYRWFIHPGVAGYAVMVGAGLVIGVTIEWVAVHILVRWMYTAWMPRVPGLAVGLVPLLQMLVLPPFIFHLVARWQSRAAQCR